VFFSETLPRRLPALELGDLLGDESTGLALVMRAQPEKNTMSHHLTTCNFATMLDLELN
jgi:hypothetical protein